MQAMEQRRKGRDLFDLWVALSKLHLDPKQIVAAFAPYRPMSSPECWPNAISVRNSPTETSAIILTRF
jgi:hypothetical protein